jgi:serine/threonine protein kinase
MVDFTVPAPRPAFHTLSEHSPVCAGGPLEPIPSESPRIQRPHEPSPAHGLRGSAVSDASLGPLSPVRFPSPRVRKRPVPPHPTSLPPAMAPNDQLSSPTLCGISPLRVMSDAVSSTGHTPPETRGPSPSPENRAAPSKVGSNTKIRLSNTKILGKGTWGTVYVGWNEVTRELIAVKEIKFGCREDVEQAAREIRVMKALEHPNVIRYLGADRDGNTLKIYMEYMVGGSLASLIKNFGPLSETMAAGYCVQVLKGLQYLHSLNIAHRDIKCDNLLVEKNGDVKLADFGQSKDASEILKTVTGTAYFMAPEVIKGGTYTLMADIWSFGCAVIEMVTGQPPFSQAEHQWAAMYQISQEDPSTQFPEAVSLTCRAFLGCCMIREPSDRWPASRLLCHAFLEEAHPLGDPHRGRSAYDSEDDRMPSPVSCSIPGPAETPERLQSYSDDNLVAHRRGKRRTSATGGPRALDATALEMLAAAVAGRPLEGSPGKSKDRTGTPSQRPPGSAGTPSPPTTEFLDARDAPHGSMLPAIGHGGRRGTPDVLEGPASRHTSLPRGPPGTLRHVGSGCQSTEDPKARMRVAPK